jgi:hypothetical protein
MAEPVYVSDITFGWDSHLRGHWSDRIEAIDQDLARMKKLLDEAKSGSTESSQVLTANLILMRELARNIASPSQPSRFAIVHEPPKKFEPGEEIAISATVNGANGSASRGLQSGQLCYRHVNQAENYQTAEMKADGDRWVAVIPAEYTQSPFPLQYYFKLHSVVSQRSIYPGLGENLCTQPYYVIRQR